MTFPTCLPVSRVPDPAAALPLGWGIAGPGWIAERFAHALTAHTRQRLAAVGSRSRARAAAFAERWDIPRAYDDLAQMNADPGVDIVYVATPHNHHLPVALAAIEAGKHVLVEKPLALNVAEAERLRDTARQHGVLLVEALWTAFLPKFDVIRQLLDDGALGKVHTVIADHGEHFGPDHRIMRPDLAGGPMLDLGTYAVALSQMVLGEPEDVRTVGAPASSGVNGQVGMTFRHAGGALSLLHCTLLGHTTCQAVLSGTDGMLTMPRKFYEPGSFILQAIDLTTRLVHDEAASGYAGLCHEIAHIAECVAEGRSESPVLPLEQTIATLRSMDRVRERLGIVFDEERSA
ncbi:Gfo/Idh/MocA family oxidoreductase [uncultured Jannaschia sp.]|uniref:Gfo/Idh/MocA family protein n=1 Tax=uncultured Jannaschia sp. TaxID=293347 RepID=UPI002630BFC9|nr:Gfo/Idh/MocA family oxidoreductase [uncultured Jannaschia sp.]